MSKMDQYLDVLNDASVCIVRGVLCIGLSLVPGMSLVGLQMEYVLDFTLKEVLGVGVGIAFLFLGFGVFEIVRGFLALKKYDAGSFTKEDVDQLEEMEEELESYKHRKVIGYFVCGVGVGMFLARWYSGSSLPTMLFMASLMNICLAVGLALVAEGVVQMSVIDVLEECKGELEA